MSVSPGWHAVDVHGRDLATGGRRVAPGFASPAAALAGAPVMTWPVAAISSDGRRVGVHEALGPGGQEVERLLERLTAPRRQMDAPDVALQAVVTPTGALEHAVCILPLAAAVEASQTLDPAWVQAVESVRSQPREPLVKAGRACQLEAGLHLTMLLAAEVLDPHDATDVDAHVASGGQLWLLAAFVPWALAEPVFNPFSPWSELVLGGFWPVGPSGDRLVVAETRCLS